MERMKGLYKDNKLKMKHAKETLKKSLKDLQQEVNGNEHIFHPIGIQKRKPT